MAHANSLATDRGAEGSGSVSTATRILDAAEGLFSERGFAAVSIREIAAHVGLNQASIYNHFASKQALYEAVLERGLRPIRDLLERGAADLDTPEAGDRLLDALIDCLWNTPRLPKLMQREVLDDGEYLDRLAQQWLQPIYKQGRATFDNAPGRSTWQDDEVPLILIGMYHLIFGHFLSAALTRRVTGADPFDPAMRDKHAAFLKRAVRRLLAGGE